MPVTVESLERLVRDGRFAPDTFSDGRHNWRRWKADFAGNCERPVTVEHNARPTTRKYKRVVVPRDGKSLTVNMQVPCRQCDNCLKRRAAHWRLRAVAEYRAGIAVGARTWLTTLTIEPAKRHLVLSKLRYKAGYKVERKPGQPLLLDFDALLPHEQFAEKHREISKEITKYMKRVRTNSAAPLRHLIVCERHEGGGQLHGEPHYHMLWHETTQSEPLRKAVLDAAWKWGFSQSRLVKDMPQALYICKYLSKSSLARVRASGDYGERPHDIVKRDP